MTRARSNSRSCPRARWLSGCGRRAPGWVVFLTPTGVGTDLADGKQTMTVDGKDFVLEKALRGDFALIKAYKADPRGNLIYRKTARNFNPIMAMAADYTIAEVQKMSPWMNSTRSHCDTGRLRGHLLRDRLVRNRQGAQRMSEQTNLLTRQQIAARAAQDMEDGWLVNLGIGMPTMIPALIPKGRDVMFHSENGLIGMGRPRARTKPIRT